MRRETRRVDPPAEDWRTRTRDSKVERAEGLLRDGARTTVAGLARELGCSERTAYYVLRDLAARGVPVAREVGNATSDEIPRYFLAG